jgi:hypothetical protein
MTRLNVIASWVFICLGISLLILVPLVAPGIAFADEGFCDSQCCTMCTPPGYNCDNTSMCYTNCWLMCINGDANCSQGFALCKTAQDKTDCLSIGQCNMDKRCACQWIRGSNGLACFCARINTP